MQKFFNFLIFYLLLIPITIVISLAITLLFFIPTNYKYWLATRWSHSFIFLAKNILGLKYEVKGLENLPPAPYVVLCNHQSIWETIFMQVMLPPQSWVLKRELLYIPFFGWALVALQPIAINRSNRLAAKKILAKGAIKLANNRVVLIYPEGTRVAPGTLKKLQRTGAALAKNSNVPIVPIAHNSGVLWPKGCFLPEAGTITVTIGKPIDSLNLDIANINAKVTEFIQAHL